MPALNQILEANDDTSSEFVIKSQKQISLQGTIGAAWTVERSVGEIGDGQTRNWVVDTQADTDETAVIVTGTEGFVYRINLGSGNGAAGLTGYESLSFLAVYR